MSLFLVMAVPLAIFVGRKLTGIQKQKGLRRALLSYLALTLVLDIPLFLYDFWGFWRDL